MPDAVNRYCKAVQQTLTKDELALRVYLANYLWYWQSFTLHPDFAHAAKQFYKAEAYGVDFRDTVGTAKKIIGLAQSTTNPCLA